MPEITQVPEPVIPNVLFVCRLPAPDGDGGIQELVCIGHVPEEKLVEVKDYVFEALKASVPDEAIHTETIDLRPAQRSALAGASFGSEYDGPVEA